MNRIFSVTSPPSTRFTTRPTMLYLRLDVLDVSDRSGELIKLGITIDETHVERRSQIHLPER